MTVFIPGSARAWIRVKKLDELKHQGFSVGFKGSSYLWRGKFWDTPFLLWPSMDPKGTTDVKNEGKKVQKFAPNEDFV